MDSLTHNNIIVMFFSLGILLGVARLLGELAQKFGQPAVLGEILTGILLGPTVLGRILPGLSATLFPLDGPNAIVLNAISMLAIVLFLLVAGMEVDLSSVFRQGRAGFKVGTLSIIIPFLTGFGTAWLFPQITGQDSGTNPLIFSLFFATALSISALPVIVKTLMDMDLYRTDLGMVVVSAAVFNDVIGWIIFAIILGMIQNPSGFDNHILLTIFFTLSFTGLVLTLGRRLIDKCLPFFQTRAKWPAGEMDLALILALFGAAFTEWIGIHAIFGSFLIGVAIGDTSHLEERSRTTIKHFVSFFFAPVFFASIGLKTNFLTNFDARLVLVVLLIACMCKLAGGVLGARWGGMPANKAWAVGFAMNSRGAMEIILGILALEAGIIGQKMFVALVLMAIVTSMMSGPLMRLALNTRKNNR
jgi:Kef-type K+ transport system membrane component KefB